MNPIHHACRHRRADPRRRVGAGGVADHLRHQGGCGDLYEKTSSQLVLATSKNAKLREVRADDGPRPYQSTADVKAAAAKAGVTVPAPKLDAMAHATSRRSGGKGTARDSLYVTQQKAAHQRALTLHQGYAANGTSAPLKMVARADRTGGVQTHLTELQAM